MDTNLLENRLLSHALDFTKLSLAGKRRLSGEEVGDHCLRVAEILTRFKVTDENTLTVAIIHHTLKESAANIADVKEEFGEDIATLLASFERLNIVRIKPGMNDEFAENLRKMFLALAKDLRVVLIKLADILDNLTTLDYLEKEKREEVAKETLDIFAPLAERLGMGEMKGEMQDLAFRYLYPKEYEWLEKLVGSYFKKADLYKVMLKVKAKIFDILEEEKISGQVQSRVKHSYSLYTKLLRPDNDKDISKISDLIAFRVLVPTKEDCYKVLGLVNKTFRPLLQPISDFIAHPKPNGYQSIHIKLYGPGNIPFEVQIRTFRMHEEAEYGVAAHWNYAEEKQKGVSMDKIEKGFMASTDKLEWVKRLSDWQKEITDNKEFLKAVKTDFFGERIFCFTPKGDVKDLPYGATPIDFAYLVHTDLGNIVTSAKVNGKVVSLDTKLNNGDVVELILAKDLHKKPSRDWLSFVVTSIAKKKIKKAYT